MKRNTLLKILIPVVALVLIAAIVVGVLAVTDSSKGEPVGVYAFTNIGMTEYWADSQESYGPVTTDAIQTIYLSDTQTVTEIAVAVGDQVKKGDLLMVFDTTLSDLALERERLAVEKLKIQLQDAEKELIRIKNMKPMVIPVFEPEEEDPDLGTPLASAYLISTKQEFDGSSQEKALICWVKSDTQLTDKLFEAIRQVAIEFQTKNLPEEDEAKPTALSQVETNPTEEVTETTAPTEEATEPIEEPTEKPTDPPEEPTEKPTDPPEEPTEKPTDPPEEPTEKPTEPPEEPTEKPTDPPEEPEEVDVKDFYVVFKVTQGDMSLGSTIVWQGLHLHRKGDSNRFTFTLYDASGMEDHTDTGEGSDSSQPEIDFGSGYTAAQIAEMRRDQEKTIKDLEFQIKMAEANYAIKQTEAADGHVYAQFDGEVVSVLTEEEARLDNQPIIKVSGGGGYYIEGTVSELEKDSLQIGQEVTVNDWYGGMTYTGTIQSIGDSPTTNGGWSGIGNPNTSFYPFTVFVDDSADLQAGYYASVTFTSATAEHGIYLENPFLRTEQGRSYVYLRNAEGKLEKRYVTTGKSLWGSYTEILSGLTEEDYIAFPYGKTVKEGAPTRESDLSELYNY